MSILLWFRQFPFSKFITNYNRLSSCIYYRVQAYYYTVVNYQIYINGLLCQPQPIGKTVHSLRVGISFLRCPTGMSSSQTDDAASLWQPIWITNQNWITQIKSHCINYYLIYFSVYFNYLMYCDFYFCLSMVGPCVYTTNTTI